MTSQIEITRKARDRKKRAFLYWLRPPRKTYKVVGEYFAVSPVRGLQLVVHGARLFCNPGLRGAFPRTHRAATGFMYNERNLERSKNWVAEHQHWFNALDEAQRRREKEDPWEYDRET